MPVRISRDRFEQLVRDALQAIPAAFRPYLEHIDVDVEPVPDAETMRALDLSDPRDLLGLYQGVPLTERSVEDPVTTPDRIVLYQRSIEAMCDSTQQVVEEIRRTVLHEVGHHFGLDDDGLDDMGYG